MRKRLSIPAINVEGLGPAFWRAMQAVAFGQSQRPVANERPEVAGPPETVAASGQGPIPGARPTPGPAPKKQEIPIEWIEATTDPTLSFPEMVSTLKVQAQSSDHRRLREKGTAGSAIPVKFGYAVRKWRYGYAMHSGHPDSLVVVLAPDDEPFPSRNLTVDDASLHTVLVVKSHLGLRGIIDFHVR